MVRETFSREQASGWDDEIAAYVESNNLDAKLANRAEDKYFGTWLRRSPRFTESTGRVRRWKLGSLSR